VDAGGSEAAAGSILSSVLAMSALVTSLAGVDTVALVGPPRRLALYLHKTM
jgi:histidinol dehydrogenase